MPNREGCKSWHKASKVLSTLLFTSKLELPNTTLTLNYIMRALTSSYVCLDCRLSLQLRPQFHKQSQFLRRAFTTTSARFLPDNNANRHAPPTAPKQTPNIRHIRENAELYAQNCVDRKYTALRENPLKVRSLADEAATLQRDLKEPRARIKSVEKEIGRLAFQQRRDDRDGKKKGGGGGGDAVEKQLNTLREEAKRLKQESEAMTLRREQCVEDMHRLALTLPNLTAPETPVGDDPRLVSYINYDPRSPPAYVSSSSADSRSHVAIGTELGILDFTSSAASTGWGWYYLTGHGALLEHALVQYALTTAMKRGWTAVSPPSIVYAHIAEACGFQPRDQHNEQQIYAIEQSDKDKERGRPGRVLAGTAEIPLAAMYAGRDVQASELPLKMVGASRCYRAEAGSRGVDTKGLYRVHEFTKVELFGWTDTLDQSTPTSPSTSSSKEENKKIVTSDILFDEMLALQTEILTALNLPCRILEMPSSDLGASATRKRDIEALFPSRLHRPTSTETKPDLDIDSGWGEVTSASICTDYQARRLSTRVRADGNNNNNNKDGSGPPSRFAHTVNGTALAVPRVIAAILENGWDERVRGVVVPEVLRGFMGGVDVMRRVK